MTISFQQVTSLQTKITNFILFLFGFYQDFIAKIWQKFVTSKQQASQKSIMKKNDFGYYEELGKGSYGRTFAVKKKFGHDKGTKYAMKISLKKNIQSSLMELTILKLLNSNSFVVKLFYSFQDPYCTYLCLEIMEGGTLRIIEKSRNFQFDRNAAVFYGSELIYAISEMHKLGIVHRDLKPCNILLTAEGHIRIGDFGTALKLKDGEYAYEEVGTIAYIVSIFVL